MKSACKRL